MKNLFLSFLFVITGAFTTFSSFVVAESEPANEPKSMDTFVQELITVVAEKTGKSEAEVTERAVNVLTEIVNKGNESKVAEFEPANEPKSMDTFVQELITVVAEKTGKSEAEVTERAVNVLTEIVNKGNESKVAEFEPANEPKSMNTVLQELIEVRVKQTGESESEATERVLSILRGDNKNTVAESEPNTIQQNLDRISANLRQVLQTAVPILAQAKGRSEVKKSCRATLGS